MVDYITPIVGYWINYVFGDVLLASIVFVMFFVIWGIKRRWSLDMFAIVLLPIISIMTYSIGIFQNIYLLLIIPAGVIIAIALLRLLK